MSTLKALTIPKRLSWFGMDVVTSATGATCIGRWYKHNWYTRNSRLVADKQPQLIESPVVGSAAFLFSARFLVKGLSDIGQILKRQCRTQLSRFSDQRHTDIVVDPLLESSFSAREPSQELPRTPSAMKRDVGSYPAVSIPNLLQLSAIPRLTRRGCGDVTASQVNTNNLGCFTRWWGVKFNGNVDVVAPIPTLYQCSTGGRLPRQQCALVIANQQLERVALVYQRNPNLFGLGMVDKRPSIQADAGRTKLLDSFSGFQVAQYPTNRLTNVIGFQPSRFLHRLVGQVMQLGGVVALVQLSRYQDLIASISKPLHRAVNYWRHFVGDLKLARYRQGLSHALIILHPLRDAGKTNEFSVVSLGFRNQRSMWRANGCDCREFKPSFCDRILQI